MAKRKLKLTPCPNCGNADLIVGDCGYSSFNVAWVKCPKCKLETKVTGDSAVASWNLWCRDPVGQLIDDVREKANEKRRMRREEDVMTMEEYAADQLELLWGMQD